MQTEQKDKEKERKVERKKTNKCITVSILQFQNERLVISDLKTEYEERPKKGSKGTKQQQEENKRTSTAACFLQSSVLRRHTDS